jgi:hypothetical protein
MMQIIEGSSPRDQAKIIKGVLDMVDMDLKNGAQQDKAKQKLLNVAARLESDGWVEAPEPEGTSETVFEALKDAEVLLEARGPTSAVDRAHTALHGYFKHICADRGVIAPTDPSLTALFKLLREAPEFSEFSRLVAHDEQAKRVMGALSLGAGQPQHYSTSRQPRAS